MPALASFAACGSPHPTGAPDAGEVGNIDANAIDGPLPICAEKSDCDDGSHCSGVERCDPTATGADSQGCIAGDPMCIGNSPDLLSVEDLVGDDRQQIWSVAQYPDGGLVVAGSFRGTMTIGTSTLISAGDDDGFVLRFAPDGDLEWARRYGSATPDGGDTLLGDGIRSVVVDAQDNIYVGGYVQGEAVFGAFVTSPFGAKDGFVARITPSGQVDWVERFGGTSSDMVRALAVGGGEIAVAGSFRDVVDFGDGERSATGLDGFLLVLSSSTGTLLWSSQLAGNRRDQWNAVARASDGTVFAAGVWEDASVPQTGYSQGHVAVAAYRDGVETWRTIIGGTHLDEPRGVALAASTIYVAGNSHSPTLFHDDQEVLQVANEQGGAGFLMALTPDGGLSWAKSFFRTASVNSIATSPSGDAIVAGRFWVTLEVEGSELGSNDSYFNDWIGAYDSSGAHRWTFTYYDEDNWHDHDLLSIVSNDTAIVAAGWKAAYPLAVDRRAQILRLEPAPAE